jgi:hypothetical protein
MDIWQWEVCRYNQKLKHKENYRKIESNGVGGKEPESSGDIYVFGMYEPDTNSVIINAINDIYSGTPLIISCEKYNSAVLLDTPNDIAYLYRLAQESPLLYAELACKPNGLQEYVDTMNEFN